MPSVHHDHVVLIFCVGQTEETTAQEISIDLVVYRSSGPGPYTLSRTGTPSGARVGAAPPPTAQRAPIFTPRSKASPPQKGGFLGRMGIGCCLGSHRLSPDTATVLFGRYLDNRDPKLKGANPPLPSRRVKLAGEGTNADACGEERPRYKLSNGTPECQT